VNRILDRLKDDPHVLGGADRNPAHVAAMESAKALVPQLATTDAKKEFVKLLRSILDPSMKENDDASAASSPSTPDVVRECSNTRRRARGSRRRGGGGSS